jgi:hypothetical protein
MKYAAIAASGVPNHLQGNDVSGENKAALLAPAFPLRGRAEGAGEVGEGRASDRGNGDNRHRNGNCMAEFPIWRPRPNPVNPRILDRIPGRYYFCGEYY